MSGSTTISVEIELAWGFHDKQPPSEVPELSENGQQERETLQWLLNLCDKHGITITFDIVGHLLLDSCSGRHDGPHADGWFARDPGTSVGEDPLFYAPEVVEWIRAADVDHEICTHTFSHVLCDEVSEEVLDWELTTVADLHDETVASLVPPRHRAPPYGVLRDRDIDTIRLADEAATPPASTIKRYLWTLTRNHPLDEPRTESGVVETRTSPLVTLTAPYLSRGVADPHPAYRIVPRSLRQRTHERFLTSALQRAVSQKRNVHYWTHLYNLAHEAQKPCIERFLDQLGVAEGPQTLTMGQLAALSHPQ